MAVMSGNVQVNLNGVPTAGPSRANMLTLNEADAATLVRSLLRSLRASESERRLYESQYDQTLAAVGGLQKENAELRQRLATVGALAEPVRGPSPMQAAAHAVAQADEINHRAVNAFANGATPDACCNGKSCGPDAA